MRSCLSLLSNHKRRQLSKPQSQTMLQVTGGIGDHEEGCSLAVGPPELLECARIERHRPKAFHSGVTPISCHRVGAALEDRHPKIAIVCNSKPIAISASHCIKSLHACCCSTLLMINFRAPRWWLWTSGDLVDSRGAEKGVSQARFNKNLTLASTICQVQDIYRIRL
jgi:hypothetical protein